MLKKLFSNSSTIALLLIVVLSSCSNKVEDINEAVSSFEVTPVTLEESVKHKSLRSDSAWNEIPSFAFYKFKTCLKDRAINGSIVGQSFTITTPVKSHTVRSNINGCIIWNEKVDFVFLSKEKLFGYEVAISGNGHYKGTKTLKLALNPWPKASSPLLFLENNSSEVNAFEIHELSNSNKTSLAKDNLIIQNLNFSKREFRVEEKLEIHPIDIQFDLALALKGLNDEVKYNHSISQGRFKAVFKVYESLEGKDEIYLLTSATKEISALNGKFQTQVDFYVSKKANDRSFTFLEIELAPVNSPKGVSTLRVQIPDFKINSPSATIIKDIATLTKESVRSFRNNPDPDQSIVIGDELNGDDDYGYYIKKVSNIKRGSTVSNSYNKTSIKARRAKFTLCLNQNSSAVGQIPLTDTQVKIDIFFEDGSTDKPDSDRVYKTNEDGCINTYANIVYDKFSLEKWIPFNVRVTPLTGAFTELIKTRKLTVNPWNPEDFGYDTKYETEIPKIDALAPRLFIGSVKYVKEMMDYTQFRINEFMHLSLSRKYHFMFEPKVELFHSYKDEALAESITFGEYEIVVSIYKPLTTEVDYYRPDMSNFKFITSAKKVAKALPNGKVSELISFPFLVSETQELAHKNLALLEIRPLAKGSSIKPTKIVFPFFGGNQGANMPARTYTQELPQEVRVVINQTAEHGKYLPTIDVIGDPAADPMANFSQNFKQTGIKLNPKVKVLDMKLSEFNKSATVAKWERVKVKKGESLKDKVELTARELRTLVTENTTVMPKGILSKFCRYFYKLPGLGRETSYFQRIEVFKGGDEYLSCMKTPDQHFSVTPVTHIRKILSRKSDRPSEAYATFVKSTRGEVSRGNAFFAAYGDRSSNITGNREAETVATNLTYGIEGPGPYYIGYSKSTSKEYATFKQENNADMEAAFDRYYTQRQLAKLEFDELTLSFYAQVRRCVTVIGTKTTSTRVHLCEDNKRPKKIEEQWYFIGDTRSRDHGMISDGAFPGVSGFTQVIRGKYNYNRIWNKYKEQDIKMVLEEVGDSRGVTYAFKRYLKESHSGTLYENFIDNSQPGLYIKPRY